MSTGLFPPFSPLCCSTRLGSAVSQQWPASMLVAAKSWFSKNCLIYSRLKRRHTTHGPSLVGLPFIFTLFNSVFPSSRPRSNDCRATIDGLDTTSLLHACPPLGCVRVCVPHKSGSQSVTTRVTTGWMGAGWEIKKASER